MKEEFYRSGFYLLLGLMLGSLVTVCYFDSKQDPGVRVEVVQDTLSVSPTSQVIMPQLHKHKILNEDNLKAELEKHNIPHADIVLAQAKLETGNFKSNLVKTHQNIFGMKRGKNYRKYSHWTECVADYKVRISSRYTGGCYYEFLERIGYAEDPNYSKRLRELV